MENKHLVIKALTISFFLHFLLFNLFTFTFPVKKPGHKPKIVFLGSILKQSNMSNNAYYKNTGQNIYNFNQFTKKDNTFKNNPFNITEKNKPQQPPLTKSGGKVTEKSVFKVDYQKKMDKKHIEEEIDEKYQNMRYEPIKLQTSKDLFSNNP